MQKELGKDIKQGVERIDFLDSNCDSVEEKGYMKPFTPEQLNEMKDNLASVTIEINDIEDEKREAMQAFNEQLKPHKEELKELITGIKNKAKFVTEKCYKFIDHDERMVGFYNENGDLIDSRPVYANEMQGTIFQMKRTGTTNKQQNV